MTSMVFAPSHACFKKSSQPLLQQAPDAWGLCFVIRKELHLKCWHSNVSTLTEMRIVHEAMQKGHNLTIHLVIIHIYIYININIILSLSWFAGKSPYLEMSVVLFRNKWPDRGFGSSPWMEGQPRHHCELIFGDFGCKRTCCLAVLTLIFMVCS